MKSISPIDMSKHVDLCECFCYVENRVTKI
jgi:hypothetical protein